MDEIIFRLYFIDQQTYGRLLFIVPLQTSTSLVFSHPGFKKVFLFREVNGFGHPREGIGVTVLGLEADAFEAADFIMDYLKTRAPFWKREATPDGERWVDARDSDEVALSRWKTD